ncbi:MAG: hypothetical protein K2V38_28975 [Gemmataceae bacterium]|nr:hypothetical protein [Gemmataceae bacterium]
MMKSLEKDRTRRYDTAVSLARDVERHLNGDAVEACPPTLGYRVRKAYRKNRRAVLIGGAFAAMLLAATGVSLAFGVIATRAGREAAEQRQDAESNAATARDSENRAQAAVAKSRQEQDRTRRLLHASDINHAFLDAEEFRNTRLMERLEATRPKSGEPDYRGWEWHYLDRQLHSWTSEVRLDIDALPNRKKWFAEHSSRVVASRDLPPLRGAFFTADGSRLVIPPVPKPGGEPNEQGAPGGVFDANTGKLLTKIAPPAVDATKVADGRKLLGLDGPSFSLSDLAFSPDGTWMASIAPAPAGGEPKIRVRLTELTTGRLQETGIEDARAPATLRVALRGQRVTAAWSKRAMPADKSGTPSRRLPITSLRLSIWVLGPTRTLEIECSRKGEELFDYGISPDGSALLLVRRRNTPDGQPPAAGTSPQVWSVEFIDLTVSPPRAGEIHTFETDFDFRLDLREYFQFSAGGRTCAILDRTRVVSVHDSQTGKRVGPPVSLSAKGDRGSITWSQGWLPIVVSDDGTHVLRNENDWLLLQTLGRGDDPFPIRHKTGEFSRRAGKPLPLVHLSANGSRILALSPDGTFQRWDLPQRPGYSVSWPSILTVDGVECQVAQQPSQPFGSLIVYHTRSVRGQEQPDNTMVAVYDPAAGQVVRRFKLGITPGSILSMMVSPDGKQLLFQQFSESGASEARRIPYTLLALDREDGATELCQFHVPRSSYSGGVQAPNIAFITPDSRFVVEPLVEPMGKQPAGALSPTRGPFSDVIGYRIRSTASGQERYTIRLPPGEGAFVFPTLAAGGTRLVIITTRNSSPTPEQDSVLNVMVRGFDASTGAPVWEWSLPRTAKGKELGGPLTLNFAPDGARLAIAMCGIEDFRIWVLVTGEGAVQRELRLPEEWKPLQPFVTVGPNGEVFLGDRERDQLVWNATAPEPVVRLRGIELNLERPIFSPDGRRLFAIEDRRILRVWCLETGRELMWLPTQQRREGTIGFYRGPERPLFVEGDRVYVQSQNGVLVYDGSPRPESKK